MPEGSPGNCSPFKQHFEVVLEKMSEGLVEITREGRIIYTNSAALSLVQLPLEKTHGDQLWKTSSTRKTGSKYKNSTRKMITIPKPAKKSDPLPSTGD